MGWWCGSFSGTGERILGKKKAGEFFFFFFSHDDCFISESWATGVVNL